MVDNPIYQIGKIIPSVGDEYLGHLWRPRPVDGTTIRQGQEQPKIDFCREAGLLPLRPPLVNQRYL